MQDSTTTPGQKIEFITLSQDVEDQAARYHADVLQNLIAQHRNVMVFLSGGSAIAMYAKMFTYIPSELDFNGVEAVLIDERYGTYGHPDSNEQQLREKGIVDEFEKRGANFNGMLSVQNLSPEETARGAAYRYQKSLESSKYVVMFAGIGDDGHTAGWLPTRNIDRFNHLYDHKEAVVYYEVDPLDSDNPYKQRLTISTFFMHSVHKVIVFAKGDKKKPALERVKAVSGEFSQTPALALLQARDGVVILTDQTL